jgi:hypothetical protein
MLIVAMGARRARAWSGIAVAATAALAAILTVGGCYEGFDPLDPEVLAEVARTRGDAQGFDRSGVYMGPVEVLECGCTEDVMATGYELSLCGAFETLEMLGVEPELQLELVQADGTVRVRAVAFAIVSGGGLLPVFYGPLDADGRISAAGVLQADAVAARGQVLGRIDGTLDGPDGQWMLVGEYQQRYAVDLLSSRPDVLDVGLDEQGTTTSVDCRERLALELRWSSPLSESIDG